MKKDKVGVEKSKNFILVYLIMGLALLIICSCMFYTFGKRAYVEKMNLLENDIATIKEENKSLKEKNKQIEEDSLRMEAKFSAVDASIEKPAYKIPILTVHRTVDHETKVKYYPDDQWINDASVLDKELEYLYNNGWKSIDLDEFYCWYNGKCTYDEKTFVFTIDDGDSDAYFNILPILEKYKFKGTLFSIGSMIPNKTEEYNPTKRTKLGYDIIKKLRDENSLLQVQSHTYDLHYEYDNGTRQKVQGMSREEILDDFKKNEKFEFNYIAYPYGVYTNEMLSAIKETNMKLAFKFRTNTYATRKDKRYEISRLKVNGKMTLDEFKKLFSYID